MNESKSSADQSSDTTQPPVQYASILSYLNPVFFKEILIYERGSSSSGHQRVMFALAIAIGVLVILTLSVYFPGPWRFAGRGLTLAVLAGFGFGSYGVMVPAATSVALERDRETYESLVVSSLDSHKLIVGKILGAFTVNLVGKGALFPACGLAFLMGGIPITKVLCYLFVTLCVDLCYSTLGVLISSQKQRPPRSQLYVKAPTQAQLALQRSMAAMILSSVAVFYAIVVTIPIVLGKGVALADIFENIRLLGVLHPVLCLFLWGPVKVFGLAVPLWILTAALHLLIAAPLYFKAIDSHKPATSQRSMGPRVLFLVLLNFVLSLIIGNLYEAGGRWLLLFSTTLLVATMVASVVTTAFALEPQHEGESRTRTRILKDSFFSGREMFRSHVKSAPGYLFLLGLICSAFFAIVMLRMADFDAVKVYITQATIGFLCFSTGLGLFGIFLNARRHHNETQFVLDVIAGKKQIEEVKDKDKKAEKRDRPRDLPVGLLVFSFIAPVLSWILVRMTAKGVISLPGSLLSVIKGFGLAGLIANPLCSVLPVMADDKITQITAIERGLTDLGGDAGILSYFHIALYLTLGVVAVLLCPKAPPTKAAVIEALKSKADGEEAVAAPSEESNDHAIESDQVNVADPDATDPSTPKIEDSTSTNKSPIEG